MTKIKCACCEQAIDTTTYLYFFDGQWFESIKGSLTTTSKRPEEDLPCERNCESLMDDYDNHLCKCEP